VGNIMLHDITRWLFFYMRLFVLKICKKFMLSYNYLVVVLF